MALQRRLIGSLGAVLLAGAAAAAVATGAPGELDSSFGGDGVVRTSWAPEGAYAQGVAVTPGGRIVVAGQVGDFVQSGLARYLSGGALDRTFSGDGKLKTRFAGGNLSARDVLIDSRRRILIAGQAKELGGARYGVGIARLTPHGKVDRSFSQDGIALHRIGRGAAITEIALDDRGRVVGTGHAFFGDEERLSFLVVRFLPSGRFDQSFSRNGWREISFGSLGSVANSVALDDRGRVVVGGQLGSPFGRDGQMALARLHRNGALDRSFSRDGKISRHIYDGGGAEDVAIDSRGRIVVLCRSGGTAVARYLPGGSLDPAFSEDGKLLARRRWMLPSSLAIDRRDRLILAGSDSGEGFSAGDVMRVTPKGRVDRSFDGGLAVLTKLESITDATSDSRGRIVVTGRGSAPRGESLFGTARVLNR